MHIAYRKTSQIMLTKSEMFLIKKLDWRHVMAAPAYRVFIPLSPPLHSHAEKRYALMFAKVLFCRFLQFYQD